MAYYNKFHFNLLTGVAKTCNILLPCPYGFTVGEHFNSSEEVEVFISENYLRDHFNSNGVLVKDALKKLKTNLTIDEEVYGDILLKSNKSIVFKCGFGHEFTNSPKRWFNNPSCPICVRGNSRISSNPRLNKEFSKNNISNSSDVGLLEKRNYLWECGSGHEFSQSPWHRFTLNYGCAICSKKTFKSGVNDLLTTNPELCGEWLYEKNKDVISPSELTTGSKILVWWRCSRGHEWQARVNDRANTNKSGCHICAGSKIEGEVFDFLKTFNEPLQRRDRTIIKPREVDFYFPGLKIAIEFNGEYFHSDKFLKVNYGMSAVEYHRMKIKMCLEVGVTLLFLWEDDWKNNNEYSKEELSKILLIGAGSAGGALTQDNIPEIFTRVTSNRDLVKI